MKKFLSLVLALIMAMSLVTISAGATEYEDLTDKDEIQYEEAVAVLNRLGIITGYSDGSFRPEGELTRGAAAKIITSLMIGPEAAENLTVSSAPYTDVPVDNTFAAVINYCKSAGYISGYGDGTFRPSGKLTGYAFGKMLLGALGYKSEVEGFEGAGWNMKVASVGNEAGLFDRVSFKGNEQITRQVACQLALNTLKGTLVEYSGGMNVSNGDQTIVVNPTRSYKVSNQEFASHINNKKADNSSNSDRDNWYTVEFGEEHFVDLRMVTERSAADDFGRPSNEWSYKKVTIGTYPVEPDYTYTTQVAHDVAEVSASTKTRALGLSGFKFDNDTDGVDSKVYLNGEDITNAFVTAADASASDIADIDISAIADWTDNGTLVEVYIDEFSADRVEAVVIIQTQLMEVKRVGSDYVTLDRITPDNETEVPDSGYNQEPIHKRVVDVEEDNANYSFLSGLKAGDYVAVVPVNPEHDGMEFEVGKAYTPEEVSGRLTRADIYGKTEGQRQAIGVTVGGTAYKVALWNKDLVEIKADDIKVTREDVKLYLDEYGNALRAKNVGETENFMIIKGYYSGLENGKLVRYVEGWDISGTELSLNIGSNDATYTRYSTQMRPGDLVRYTNEGAAGSAEWVLKQHGDTEKDDDGNTVAVPIYDIDTTQHTDGLKASNVRVYLDSYTNNWAYTTGSLKFIYVTFDDDGDVESIEVKDRIQTVSQNDLAYAAAASNSNPAEACLNDDGEITAIVVKKESNEAISSNLLYIRDYNSADIVDEDWGKIFGYQVAMMTPDGLDDKVNIYGNKDLNIGDFASYALTTREGYEPFYSLKKHTATRKTTSVNSATVFQIVNEDRSLVRLTDLGNVDTLITSSFSAKLGVGDEANIVDLSRAEWLDLYDNGHIDSVKDLRDVIIRNGGDTDTSWRPTIQMIYNDNTDSDGFRMVSMVVVTGRTSSYTNPVPVANNNRGWQAYLDGDLLNGYKDAGTTDWSTTSSNKLSVATADLGKTLTLKASSETTTVSPEAGYAVADGQTYIFTVTSADGDSITVTIEVDENTPTPVTSTYWLYPVNTPSSTSINVFIEKREDGQGKGWMTQAEIEALNLSAANFTLDNSSLSVPNNVSGITPVQTKYDPFGLYSYNPAYHSDRDDAAAEGDPHTAWFDQNAGFIKLQFATSVENDDGTTTYTTLIDSAQSKLTVVGWAGTVKYNGDACTSFTVNAST